MNTEDLTMQHYFEIIDYIIYLKTGLQNQLLMQIKEDVNKIQKRHVKEMQDLVKSFNHGITQSGSKS